MRRTERPIFGTLRDMRRASNPMGGEAMPNSRHAGGFSNAPEFERFLKLPSAS